MKQFLMSLLGTLAGLVIFCFTGAILFFGLMGIMVAVGGGGIL